MCVKQEWMNIMIMSKNVTIHTVGIFVVTDLRLCLERCLWCAFTYCIWSLFQMYIVFLKRVSLVLWLHPIPDVVPPPFAVIINSTLLGRLSIKFWSMAVGIGVHSATRTVMRSSIDVWQGGLAQSQRSSSTQRCSAEFRFMLCAGHSSSTISTLAKHAWTSVCTGRSLEPGKGSAQLVQWWGN